MPKKPCGRPGCNVLVEVGSSYCAVHEGEDKRVRDARAAVAKSVRPSRKWYNSKRWRGKEGRRALQLSKEPLCRKCKEEGRSTVATVADHITPHRDDYHLFWFGPLQSLCDPCHNIKKQREERRPKRGGRKSPNPHKLKPAV